MKKSNSNGRHLHNHNLNVAADSRVKLNNKNKTISTIVHTQNEHQQQQTTKKNSLNKVSSCAKMANSSCKSSKTNLIRIQGKNRGNSNTKNAGAPAQQSLAKKNEQLMSENKVLRDQYCKLQEAHLKDKAKIQLLIGRMSQIKSEQKNGNTPVQQKSMKKEQVEQECKSRACTQRRKAIQIQLNKERIKVFELEQEKRKWDKSREHLKNQYSQLLAQIQNLRQH